MRASQARHAGPTPVYRFRPSNKKKQYKAFQFFQNNRGPAGASAEQGRGRGGRTPPEASAVARKERARTRATGGGPTPVYR